MWSAAVAAAGTLGNPLVEAAGKNGGANDQLNVAVIGVRSRGNAHVTGYAGKHNCIVKTICDCDTAAVGKGMKAAEKAQGKAPKFEQDFRKVLDDKDIHAVSIATPNHWHALMAIMALKAGKHVYVEKPVSHTLDEGRLLVEAAAKSGKVCSGGVQSRTMPGMRQAMDYLHSGKLGTVKLSRGLCYKPRKSIGVKSGPVPGTVDFNLWCGPAPDTKPIRERFHYDWHWFWDYGNGDIGNQGAHEMDKARWGLKKNDLPKSVVTIGGRLGYQDNGQTANTQLTIFDYGDCELIFEVRGLDSKDLLGAKVGNIFYGSKGYLVCPGYDNGTAFDLSGKPIQTFKGKGDSFANFVKAIRSNKPEDLNCGILDSHLSAGLCHLANISYRLGKPQPADKKINAIGDDKDAAEAMTRLEQHLKDNKLPLDKTSIQVGPKLTLNAKTEKFVGNMAKEANALATKEYRKGFEMPKI